MKYALESNVKWSFFLYEMDTTAKKERGKEGLWIAFLDSLCQISLFRDVLQLLKLKLHFWKLVEFYYLFYYFFQDYGQLLVLLRQRRRLRPRGIRPVRRLARGLAQHDLLFRPQNGGLEDHGEHEPGQGLRVEAGRYGGELVT